MKSKSDMNKQMITAFALYACEGNYLNCLQACDMVTSRRNPIIHTWCQGMADTAKVKRAWLHIHMSSTDKHSICIDKHSMCI